MILALIMASADASLEYSFTLPYPPSVEIHAYRFDDKSNPRIEITVSQKDDS